MARGMADAIRPRAYNPSLIKGAGRFANSLRQENILPQDKSYLSKLVAARTGLDQSEADRRVNDTVTAYRQAVDAARKAVAHSLYWLFVALLIGAFCASYAATIGGKQRDHIPV